MSLVPYLSDRNAMASLKELFPEHAEKLRLKKAQGRHHYFVGKKQLCVGNNAYEAVTIAKLGKMNSANQPQ